MVTVGSPFESLSNYNLLGSFLIIFIKFSELLQESEKDLLRYATPKVNFNACPNSELVPRSISC